MTFPVTLVTSGGAPITPVNDGAPLASAIESGGVAITLIASGGAPLVVENLAPPTFDLTLISFDSTIQTYDQG